MSKQENLDHEAERRHSRHSFSAKRKVSHNESNQLEGGELEALMDVLEDEALLDDPDYLLEKAKTKEANEQDKAKEA